MHIVTNILVKVHSAESLYNSLRYVCKPWSNIISHHPDIHLNYFLLPSSKAPCIIIQNTDKNSSARCVYSFTTCLLKMGTREGDVELKHQVDLTPIFKKLCIWNCCNGLVLATLEGTLLKRLKTLNPQTLCIVNPLTNHRVVLPPSPINKGLSQVPIGFTFFPSTGKYKVVTMGCSYRRDQLLQYFIQILTMSSPPPAAVGHCSSDNNDADPCRHWKLIEAPEPLFSKPLAINDIYYWPYKEGYITSFDPASERFYTTPHKLYDQYVEPRWHYHGFMDFEGYLAFWSLRPTDGAGEEVETKRRTFNVHVIEDLHKKGGEWKELHSGVRLDLDFIKAGRVIPCLSFGNGEGMIFRNAVGGPLSGAYHFKSQRWLKVGINLKELNFCGYLLKSSTPVPFGSLSSLKQTTT